MNKALLALSWLYESAASSLSDESLSNSTDVANIFKNNNCSRRAQIHTRLTSTDQDGCRGTGDAFVLVCPHPLSDCETHSEKCAPGSCISGSGVKSPEGPRANVESFILTIILPISSTVTETL